MSCGPSSKISEFRPHVAIRAPVPFSNPAVSNWIKNIFNKIVYYMLKYKNKTKTKPKNQIKNKFKTK